MLSLHECDTSVCILNADTAAVLSILLPVAFHQHTSSVSVFFHRSPHQLKANLWYTPSTIKSPFTDYLVPDSLSVMRKLTQSSFGSQARESLFMRVFSSYKQIIALEKKQKNTS